MTQDRSPEISAVKSRAIALHVFCSAKGGVGKSTLAVACAKALAAEKRVPLVVDADLTGTSLADGLRLCAPKTALHTDGTVDVLASPTGEVLSRNEVVRLRRLRRDAPHRRGLPPAYLNDALRPYWENELQSYVDVRVDALLWRHEKDDGVRYLPSSALRHDMEDSLRWFSREAFDWAAAMILLLDCTAEHWPALTDVVIDVPPGLFGFSQEMLALASTLTRGGLPEGYPDWKTGPIAWNARVFLVTTPDLNDMLPVYEYVAQNITELLGASILVNKNNTVISTPDAIVGAMLAAQVDTRRIHPVPFLGSSLGRIFVDGDLDLKAIASSDAKHLARLFVSEDVT